MIEAAKNGDIKSLRKQIKNGRAPYLKDGNGLTALHHAVKNGHLNCVNYLLRPCMEEHNLTRIQASKGFNHLGTPIALACRFEEVSIAIIKALIKADPEAVDICMPAGGNALHAACRSQRPAVVQLLLDAGADVNARSNSGLRPLHTAAQSNDLSCLKILLEAGADTNLCNLSGCTPLLSSVLDEYISCADELLNYMGPEGINLTTRFGYTVLMKVAEFDYKHLIEKLILKGADPYIQAHDGRFAIDFTKNYECAKVLVRAMDRKRLQHLKHRDIPYPTMQKKIVKLICSSIPELFEMQIFEYVLYHWRKYPEHCIDIIRMILTKLQPRTRMSKLGLSPSRSTLEVLDAYLSVCKRDVILYWRDNDIIDKPSATPIALDRYIDINIDFLVLLASNNPRYSPSFIANRYLMEFKCKINKVDIPESWELKYDTDEDDDYVKPVQSLKHLSRCCIRDTFYKNGLVSRREFQNGLEELGLPKSVQSYLKYTDI